MNRYKKDIQLLNEKDIQLLKLILRRYKNKDNIISYDKSIKGMCSIILNFNAKGIIQDYESSRLFSIIRKYKPKSTLTYYEETSYYFTIEPEEGRIKRIEFLENTIKDYETRLL